MVKTFGQILYDARTRAGLSVEDLSYMADVSARVIYDWEEDSKSPSLSNVQKLCKALHIAININTKGEVTEK